MGILHNKKNITYILVIILIIIILIYYKTPGHINEYFTTSSPTTQSTAALPKTQFTTSVTSSALSVQNNEAIQNISSLYNNSGTMVLPNLNVTGTLQLGNWTFNDSLGNLIISNNYNNNKNIIMSSNGQLTVNGINPSGGQLTVSGNINTTGNVSASEYLFNSGWNINTDASNNLNFTNTADASSNGSLIFGSHLDKIYMPGQNFGIYTGKPGTYQRYLYVNGFIIGQNLSSDNNTANFLNSYTVKNVGNIENLFANTTFLGYKQ